MPPMSARSKSTACSIRWAVPARGSPNCAGIRSRSEAASASSITPIGPGSRSRRAFTNANSAVSTTSSPAACAKVTARPDVAGAAVLLAGPAQGGPRGHVAS